NETKFKLILSKNIKGTVGGADKGILVALNIEYGADNKTFKTCYSSLDNAIKSAKVESCEDLGGVYSEVDGKCNLLDETKKQIVLDGLDLLPETKKMNMYLVDGVLTTNDMKSYTCQISGKRCSRVS